MCIIYSLRFQALLVAVFAPRTTINIVEGLREDIYSGKFKSGSEINAIILMCLSVQ